MNATPNMLYTAFKMLAALGLVLGGLGVFFFFAKRLMHRDVGGSPDKLIRVLASQYMGVKKNISVVQVPGALLVLGITSDSIRLLTKIKDKEILEQIQKQASGHIGTTFTDQLNKITGRFLASKNGDEC